jgi:hypothetical protein
MTVPDVDHNAVICRDRSAALLRHAADRVSPVIIGSHGIVFSRDPEADRAFFADVLGQPHVDAGGGWLIFKLPAAELAMHPSEGPTGHELYFMCDDLEATVSDL